MPGMTRTTPHTWLGRDRLGRSRCWQLAARWPCYAAMALTIATDAPARDTDAQAAAPVPADPWQWLEDVGGDKALNWVRERNKASQAALESDPGFEKLRTDLLAILDSDARIPRVVKRGGFYYNFWRDKKNPRGLWRRTTMDEYRKAEPAWELILDLDALGKTEKENWVWAGAELLRPAFDRALISLSRGGADAEVVREFDLGSKNFVAGGFELPEAKGGMGWVDRDHVFVQTDFGAGSMTDSGYPRLCKLWKRGTPLDSARVIFEGQKTDMSVAAMHDDAPGFERNFVRRSLAFYNNELFLLDPEFKLTKLEVPNSASTQVFHQWLSVELRDDWSVEGMTFKAGSLLVTGLNDFMAGKRDFHTVFEPTATTSLARSGFTRDHLYLNVLEDVKNRLYVIDLRTGDWKRQPLAGAPPIGTLGLSPVDADESNQYFLTTTDYLTPTTLSLGEIGQAPERLKSLPAFFDATGLEITQHFATSDDGTRVPYFMVARKEVAADGSNPTLLYGYGGFEISLQPTYSAGVGRAWTSQGGVYVVANIRGGGEYGPRWHQAALKAQPASGVRGLRGRGPRPLRAQNHFAAPPGHSGRLERRPARRQHGHALSGPDAGRRLRSAAPRHAPVQPTPRRRLLDGGIRQPRQAGGVGIHPQVLALPQRPLRPEIPRGFVHHLDPRRPRPPRPRPQDDGVDAIPGP